jgi:hypothetical protein
VTARPPLQSAAVDRRMILWTLVAFFGASIAFNAVIDATADEPLWVTVLLEVAVLAAIVGFIVVLLRVTGRR